MNEDMIIALLFGLALISLLIVAVVDWMRTRGYSTKDTDAMPLMMASSLPSSTVTTLAATEAVKES